MIVKIRDVMYALPRHQVGWFAFEMEAKLQKNDGKGGWDECGPEWLVKRARQELDELERALKAKKTAKEVIGEAADVANFCMMLADVVAGFDEQGCWPPRGEE